MPKLGFLFSVRLFEATASIQTMRMLAEQASKNIESAVKESRKPGAVRKIEVESLRAGDDGEPEPYDVTYYSYGPCYQDNEYEVLLKYKNLITQLTRRSALLTIYSLFEYSIKGALELMEDLSKYKRNPKDGITGNTHRALTQAIGGSVRDVNHINKIRNIIAHNDGIVVDKNRCYVSKAERESADIKIIFNRIRLGDNFLDYVVAELSRYIEEMVDAIQSYHKDKGQ